MHTAFGDGSTADARSRGARARSAGNDDLAAVWDNLAELRAIHELERAEVDAHLGQARAPVVEVPLLPRDVHDLESLAHLSRHLFA
jgi:hypothetical protein